MQDDPVRKLKVGGGEWDDSLRKIGHLRSKCYGRITRLIPFFRCAERYFQAFNCNSPGVSGGVSSPIKQPFQAELAYAWFVASGSVKAEGMKVQAQAESGLLIRGVSKNESGEWTGGTWATSANAANTNLVSLRPTSTINLTNWYMASSDVVDDARPEQDVSLNPQAYREVTGSTLDTYRRVDTFAIRSASGADLSNVKLAVKSVSATTTGSTTSDLNSSIRVGVRMVTGAGRGPDATKSETGSTFYIFAPSYNGEKFVLTANYSDGNTLDEFKAASSERDFLYIKGDKIPFAETGVMVEVYTWYEGEDEQCKTANITDKDTGVALDADDLNISVVFEKVDLPAST